MDEETIANAEAYAARHQLRLIGRLGFGIHGIVWLAEGNAELGTAALKAHFHREPYLRERAVYERLAELGVTELRGFEVPQLLGCDDSLRVLKMTVVAPPHVLDFAGAWLDFPPEFSHETWADWTRKNQEQFGASWPMAQVILGDLQDLGIHMHDPSPSNIRFE
ncbi:MAG: hypothetical protein DVB27_01785 [Verrucomicrobia bacterium]|nr:MAG: hypothetical protein DVB27_01785 [Verrucomicrobiota bacterium]